MESRLKDGQIAVRDFIRVLILSEAFGQGNDELNHNYRLVLGRNIDGDHRKIAWSIVLAVKGGSRFGDALLGSKKYLSNFGSDRVPYRQFSGYWENNLFHCG